MIGKGVARRYATALFKVGVEDDQVEQYGQELQSFADFLEGDKEIKLYLTTPLFEKTLRQQVLENLLEKLNLSDVIKRFVNLLFDKKRLLYLKDICDFYNTLLDEYKGICRSEVISAVPLAKEDLEKIKERLKATTGKKEVVLEVKEDPSLVGGLITKIGDVIYDGSVRTQLNILKENLKRGEV
ncbi:MAG: F0F1 ATP synthase subunit delta [Candidatus Desulfofervidaceae bacterium]|nr:F0F1 ATP synthase subunit delta [Candidatus Desulfofervidaceae bacterium]